MIVCVTFYVLNVATRDADDDDESLKSWQKKEIKGIKKTRVKEEKTTIEHQSDLIFTPDLHGYNIYMLKYGRLGGGKILHNYFLILHWEKKSENLTRIFCYLQFYGK